MRFENIPTSVEWLSARSMFGDAGQTVKRIDGLIKRYHQVFDMAKLNILMELKNTTLDWADTKDKKAGATGDRQKVMVALFEVVTRKLRELDGWGQHRYILAACIGYKMAVGGYDPNLKPASDLQRRMAERSSVQGRCAQLKSVIQTAYNKYQSHKGAKKIQEDEDRKTLKIFMAPEFYFRGPYGAYRDIGWNSRILEIMREETGKAQYADWLFVHGTALFGSEKEKEVGKTMVSEGLLLDNFALVQKGGPKTGELCDFVVMKEFPSHVDFNHPGVTDQQWYQEGESRATIAGVSQRHIRETATVKTPEGPRPDHSDRWNLATDKVMVPENVSELVGGSIFTMDGITFGLEVCRDHLMGKLAHSSDSGKALIQLIPSCGASIDAESVACVKDGIVFNVDGDGSGKIDMLVNSVPSLRPSVATEAPAQSGQIGIFDAAKIPF